MSNPSTSSPRVALIGISGYGRIYLQLVRESLARGALQLVAAVVINPDEEAENVAWLKGQNCRIYADYREMLQAEVGRIDLCLVPTGIHWHARMTIDALAAGAHVLVEKPLCATLTDAAEIEAAERKYGRFVAVGFQDYYEPGTLWLKQHLVDGAIGPLKSVRFLGLWPRARAYFQRNDWAGRLTSKGDVVLDSPLNNAFAHFVMLSLYFADPALQEAAPVEIGAAELYRAHAIESFDTAVVLSRAASGIELWFGVTHSCRSTIEPVIEIHGERGVASWRYEQEAWYQPNGGPKIVHRLLSVEGARQHMLAAVLRKLHDPAESVCTPRLASRHTAFIAALHSGQEIRDFDPALVAWGSETLTDQSIPLVRGLEPALRTAYANGSALQSDNATWAVAS